MTRTRILVITLVLAATLAPLAAYLGARHQTRAVSEATEAELKQFVARSSAGQAQLEKLIDGPPGIRGALVRAKNERFVAWIPNGTKTLLVGALFDEKGDNLTVAAMKAHELAPGMPSAKPEPVPQKSGELIDSIGKATGFTDGTSGLLVHAFIDLNCHFCAELNDQLRPLVDAGKVRVHWIPVAVLDPSSTNLAAQLLQAPQAQALTLLQEHQRGRFTGGTGLPGVEPSAQSQQVLAANGALLRVVAGEPRTPYIIFKAANGRVYSHPGLLHRAEDLLQAGL